MSIKTTLSIFSLLLAATAHANLDVFRAPLPREQQDSIYSGIYLDIDKVMEREKISRFEAAETQRRVKDQLVASPSTFKEAAFAQALAEVRAGKYASGWNPKIELKSKADAIVVIDLDETLLGQWYESGDECHDLAGITPDTAQTKSGEKTSSSFVKFAPGVEGFLRKIKATPHVKGIAFFTGKNEAAAADLFAKWHFADGTLVRDFVQGIFTRNYLIVNDQTSLPSKDMRILDPGLQNVLLIDDNTARVLQPQVQYVEPKFSADDYCKALNKTSNASTAALYYEGLLTRALEQITQTIQSAEKLDVTFAKALFRRRALHSAHSPAR